MKKSWSMVEMYKLREIEETKLRGSFLVMVIGSKSQEGG
jgi:hypothetical protein